LKGIFTFRFYRDEGKSGKFDVALYKTGGKEEIIHSKEKMKRFPSADFKIFKADCSKWLKNNPIHKKEL